MAQLISVRLQRTDNTPWGFRLQGGKDFGSPLVIQKVNGNSIAERAGLQAGDAVLRVNSTDVFNLRHKEAQDTIVRAGPNFEITVQRGSQTWKPSVIPTGNIPSPTPHMNNNVTVTKTSLVSNTPPQKPIGTGHNVQPKPFLNGNSDLKLVNKQYNSPMALYSEESIAETLSAQTEVLPTGALGVNFKKNERSYNAEKSEVLKMLQEAENDPKDAEPAISSRSEFYSHASHAIGGRATSPRPLTPIAQKMMGVNQSTTSASSTAKITSLTPPPSHRPSLPITQDSPICTDCERVIVGVFVRIKDKNLHVECFKCSTCGTSLKNVGYYNINNKLYCDIHAKLAARSNQPGPNMVPVTIPPGGKMPVGTISAALASHPLPSAGPLSPSSNSSGPLPPYSPSSSVLSGPRPFSSNAAPLSPLSPVSAPMSTAPFSNHAATLPRAATQNLPDVQQQSSSEIIEQTIVETSESTSVEQTIDSNKSTCLTWPPPRIDEEVPTATPLYVPPSPSNPVLVRPPRSLSQTRDQFYTAETAVTEHREFSQKEETSQFTEQIGQTKQEYRKVMAPGIRVSSEDESISNELSGEPGSSCSAEVQDINSGRRSTTECAENIVETVDTQRLVESIKKQYGRPPSPPPPEIVEEQTFSQKEPINAKTEEAKKEQNQSINKVEEVTNIAKKVVDDVQKQLQNVAKQVDFVQKKLENVQENKAVQSIEKSNQQSSAKNSSVQQTKVQQSTVQQSSVQQSFEQVQSFQQISQTAQVSQKSMEINISSNAQEIPQPMTIPQNICLNNLQQVCSQTCQSSGKTICTEVENLQQSCLRQQQSSEKVEISSNISNPVPKAWTSPLVTALTTASSEPFSTLSTSESYISQQNEQSTVDVNYPHSDGKVVAQPSSLLTSGLTIAPARPFTPVPPTSNDPIPLPEETKPYFPPEISKDPIPRAPEMFDPKTPLLDALTTAPIRKYTPITKEVIAQQDDLMKDLPPGPYPQIDLLAALTTAPERPFTPVWGVSGVNVSSGPTASPAHGQESLAKTTGPPKIPKTHTDFKPAVPKIVAESIKPPTYKPPEVPVVKSFPPVTNELKCTFKPSTEFGASKIVQSSTQQSTDLVSKEFHSEEVQFIKSSSEHASITESQISRTESCTKQPVRPISGLHEATKIPAYQQNIQNVQSQKSKESTAQKTAMSTEHSEEVKVGTLKTQFEQYSLHKPDSIPSYQRSISPVGVRKAAPPHFDILKDGKEHDKVVAHEYTQEIAHKTAQQQRQEVQEHRRSEGVAKQTWKPIQVVQSTPPQQLPQQIPAVSITQPPTQKVPIQTILPGEIPPNIPKMSFQPVVDTPLRPATPSSSRPARAVSPSLINKPAPIIPYYQMSLVPTEHLAPETNLYDPKSPEISRAPTPRLDRAKSPIGRAQSPFPRARTPVPAGPPPSPLRAQAPRVKPEPDPSVKKQVSYVVTQAANYLEDQSQKKQVQFQQGSKCGSLTTSEFSENIKAQTANLRAQATAQQKSIETSSDGLVQVQRKKTVTEEFERTRKQVDIERFSSASKTKICQTTSENAPFGRQLSVESAHGTKVYETSTGKPVQIPTSAFSPSASQENLNRPKPVGGVPTPFSGSSAFNPVQTKSSGFPTAKPVAPAPISVPPGFKPLPGSASLPKPASNVPKPFSGSSAFKTFTPKPSDCCGGPPCQSTGLNACAALIKPSASIALAPVVAPTTSSIPSAIDPLPNAGAVGANAGPKLGGNAASSKGKQAGAVGVAPRRGRGILNKAAGIGARVPLCGHCNAYVRGPFITALGKIWCPEHFICATPSCRRPLQDLGFVEERGQLYCEYCFEQYLAPTCDQCHSKVKGDCLKAIGKQFHPECFKCGYCGKLFGNSPFFLEDGLPYCEADWNELFTTKCFACGFPVEAGDRWVEALNNNYHSQCFNCTMCKKNLEGQSFYAKGGRPFCKNHAR